MRAPTTPRLGTAYDNGRFQAIPGRPGASLKGVPKMTDIW
jgi:hypothetical protein